MPVYSFTAFGEAARPIWYRSTDRIVELAVEAAGDAGLIIEQPSGSAPGSVVQRHSISSAPGSNGLDLTITGKVEPLDYGEEVEIRTIASFVQGANLTTSFVTLQGPPWPAPKAGLTASPKKVLPGEEVTLTWTSDYAASATLSAPAGASDKPLGAVQPSGSETVKPSSVGKYTYRLQVRGNRPGSSARAQDNVEVVDRCITPGIVMRTNADRTDAWFEATIPSSQPLSGMSFSDITWVNAGSFGAGYKRLSLTRIGALPIYLETNNNYTRSASGAPNFAGVWNVECTGCQAQPVTNASLRVCSQR